MNEALLALSFVLTGLLSLAVMRLQLSSGDRAAESARHGRRLGHYGEQLSELRGELNVIRARLKGHDSHLEHVDKLACQAHGQSVLTDDRLDEFSEWAAVARAAVLARVEEAASGLVTAANVLRLIPSQAVPDATIAEALRCDYGAGMLPPIDERHHDDDGPNQ